MNQSAILLFVVLALSFTCATARAGEIHECDRLVAHPSDPDHVGSGVGSADVVTHRAIPACRQAVSEHPEVARFHYQLGRALVYWADANNGDIAEGIEHLQHAADMQYSQAMFVLGLMHIRGGDICASEPLTKSAADQGLKSARISYVNAVLAGDYGECGVTATITEMTAYLDGAAAQVKGYYENMLLKDLQRRLKSIAPTREQP